MEAKCLGYPLPVLCRSFSCLAPYRQINLLKCFRKMLIKTSTTHMFLQAELILFESLWRS